MTVNTPTAYDDYIAQQVAFNNVIALAGIVALLNNANAVASLQSATLELANIVSELSTDLNVQPTQVQGGQL